MATALHALPQTFKRVNSHAAATVPSPSKAAKAAAHGPANGKAAAAAASSASTEPFYRLDTVAIKKKLVIQLGEGFWPYWLQLKEFLVGRLRRDEFETLVKARLDTDVKRMLHNQLLTAILHNASSSRPIGETLTASGSSSSAPGSGAQGGRKRSRAHADADTDTDGADEPPRSRVQSWVLGMSKAARDRLKAELAGFEEAKPRPGRVISEMQRGWQGRAGKVVAGTRTFGFNRDPASTPSCSVTRTLPNAEQLQKTLNAIAREHGLSQGAGETAGEFLVLALETHLENIMHAAVQMKAHDRPPPATTITLASQHTSVAGDTSVDSVPELTDGSSASTGTGPSAGESDGSLTLADLHALFDFAPHLHPHAGSAVFKLRNGLLEAEEEEERVAEQWIAEKQRRGEVARQAREAAAAAEPATSAPDPDADPLPSSKGLGGTASRQFSLPPSRAASTAGDMSAKLEETSVEDVLSAPGPADWTAMLDAKGLIRAIEDKKKDKAGAGAATAGPAGAGAGTPVPAAPGKKEKKEDSTTHWAYIDPSEILRDVLG